MMNRKDDWSILGFGCMRLPKKGNSFDREEATREIGYAIDHGVTYFDTAYIYPGNEKLLGQILADNQWREKVHIATKLPHYMIKSMDNLEKQFQEQLERLQTDYVDNYLMHMLPDVDIWQKLVDMGILDWIARKKECGQIRNLGFSYHGNTRQFLELLEVYDWDFCQVQYNYMDEFSQAGRPGVQRAYEKGIPVIIMEPLRGGRLVKDLPPKATKIFADGKPQRSPAEWGLRWLWDQKEVTLVLSGMNSMEMVKENIRIAENVQAGALAPQDLDMYDQVKAIINEKVKIPCTGCSYCQPCPAGVDIPGAFRCYNVCSTDGLYKGFREYLMCTTFRSRRTNASLCRQCGKCEQHCPQGIAIRQELKSVTRLLENPIYHVIAFFGKRFFKTK